VESGRQTRETGRTGRDDIKAGRHIEGVTVRGRLPAVFAADRQPRHRAAAGTTLLRQRPPVREREREQPERKVG
jgi:hypothetical protein